MIYRIEFSKDAQKVIKKWKKSNLPLFKKLEKLIPELSEHPRTGKGHPEPLKGGNDITYSRHITAQDRITCFRIIFVPLYPLEPAKPLNDAQMCGSFYFYTFPLLRFSCFQKVLISLGILKIWKKIIMC